MKIRKLLNTSTKEVEVECTTGNRTVLSSGQVLENTEISESELNKIRPFTCVILDLTEVKGLLD